MALFPCLSPSSSSTTHSLPSRFFSLNSLRFPPTFSSPSKTLPRTQGECIRPSLASRSWPNSFPMAGNEWINGYLEAILDSGASAIDDHHKVGGASAEGARGGGAGGGEGGISFNPTKYFVEEVVSGVDETDLHRTWLKVVATRNSRERSSRLENMCWRIWHLTRKKKQVMDVGFCESPIMIGFSVDLVFVVLCRRFRLSIDGFFLLVFNRDLLLSMSKAS